MLGLTYQDLLTSQHGREIARRIVSAVINLQISRGQSVNVHMLVDSDLANLVEIG